MSGFCVYRADRNQFGGGVTLLVKNNVRHDQFVLPNVVNLETIAVCLYLQNYTPLLFVACYNPPESCTLTSTVFPSFDSVVPAGDMNCKDTAWHSISVDRNGRTLSSDCLSKNIAVNYPDHPTYFYTNFQRSVLDIALSKHCVLSKPLSVHALSDHNPVVFKILWRPPISEPRPIPDYMHANWPLFRSPPDNWSLLILVSEIARDPRLLFCSASSCI